VPAGGQLQAVLATARPGEALCLEPGTHYGPVTIKRAVTLWGPRDARLWSRAPGTTMHVAAAGTRLLGFHVDARGTRYDMEDAAIRIVADDVVVEGVEITNATFGLMVNQARRVALRGNRVLGVPGTMAGLRGDGIRLWETRDSVVERNEVDFCRDIAVWYSPHNVFAHNSFRHGRYGTHFMYSGDSEVTDNDYIGNVVGVFVMYSRNLRVHHNRFVDSSGAAGMGVGLKESGNVLLHDNAFVHNTIGLYVDTSPLYRGDANVMERNLFGLSGTAVTFHGTSAGNTFVDNRLRGNRSQVEVEGGGDARESHWAHNSFDDYVGYDLDGDGVGDVPYVLRSLTAELAAKFPDAQYFRGTAALGIVEVVGQLVPLVTPRTLIVDEQPRTSEHAAGKRHAS
jgi:nitrous oxidase accessory protein